jgi:hypothetical protein
LGADGCDFDERRLVKPQMPGLQTPAERPGERLLFTQGTLSTDFWNGLNGNDLSHSAQSVQSAPRIR